MFYPFRQMLTVLLLLGLAVPSMYGDAEPDKKASEPAQALKIRIVVKKNSYGLDLGGKTGAEYRKMLEEANKKNTFAASAAVDLVLEFHNTSNKAQAIYLDGDFFNLSWKLEGPGAVFTMHAPQITADIKIGKPISIEPGKSHSLKVGSLQGGNRATVTGACWTEPGEYTLTAVYQLKGAPLADDLNLVSTPVKLSVVAQPTGKATDYVTKDGHLKERLEIQTLQGGVRGYSGTYYVIDTDGSWDNGTFLLRGRREKPEYTLKPKGKLTAVQLGKLAAELAQHDLAALKNHGEVEVNPYVITVRFGKKSFELLPAKGKATAAEDKAIRARYDGIVAAVTGMCRLAVDSPLEMRLIAKKHTYILDLGGKSPEEFRKLLDAITLFPKKGEKPVLAPPGPVVDLELVLTNTSDKAVTIWIGGDDTNLSLELKGPGAVSKLVTLARTTDLKFSSPLVIGPGKSYTKAITSLGFPYPRVNSMWYWTSPGEYTLTASWSFGAPPAKGKEPNLVPVEGTKGLVTPPLKLRVIPAKDAVKPGRASADRLKGMKTAIADLEAGKLRLKEPPLPYPAWHPLYVDLLKSECGIDYQVVNDFKSSEMQGYNDVMRAEIEHRFGRDVLDRLHRKALEEHFNKDRPRKKDDKAPKQTVNTLWLESGLLSAKLTLLESRAEVAALYLSGTLQHQGEGKGKLVLDVKKRIFNEIGDVAGISDTADIQLECTLKYIKSMKTEVGPPLFGTVEWHLYEIKGKKISSRLFLALPEKEHQNGRLLIQDKDGKVQHVIGVRFPNEKLAPCHPGCFPAGTPIATPRGTRPIESLNAGDLVTIVRPDGSSVAGPVQSVFVTQNRLVKVETESGTLLTTPTQPLCLANGQIRAVEELQAGDMIFRWQDGQRVAVKVRRIAITERTTKVFNLVLGCCEVFIADGYLARSKPPAEAALAPPSGQEPLLPASKP